MSVRRAQPRAALLAVAAALALLATGCGSVVTGTATPEAGGLIDAATPLTDIDVPVPSSLSAPSGQVGKDTGGDVDFDVEIGECVILGGTENDATIDHASCGSDEANYKVIAKAPTNAQCIGDADQVYYVVGPDDAEQGALCLDIDWVVGGCMDLAGDDPHRMDCGATSSNGVKVSEIQQGVDDVEGCPTDGGYIYQDRRFVVCTEEL